MTNIEYWKIRDLYKQHKKVTERMLQRNLRVSLEEAQKLVEEFYKQKS